MIFIDTIIIIYYTCVIGLTILFHNYVKSNYYLYKNFININQKQQYKLITIFNTVLILLVESSQSHTTPLFILLTFYIYTLYMYIVNINILLLINGTLLVNLYSNYNLLNFFITVEFLNILTIFSILYNLNIYITWKKNIYIIIITLNIITLALFSILYLFCLYKYKTTNIQILIYFLNIQNLYYLNSIFVLIFFIKLGIILGPKYVQLLYSYLNNNTLTIYLFYYYWLLPFILIS